MNLSGTPLFQWIQGSFFYRFIGILSKYKSGSNLLIWGNYIGASLICLVLILAPFVSTISLGIVLIAIALFWLLLTVAESPKLKINSINLLVLIYWLIATVAVAFSPVKLAAFDGWIKLTLYLILLALASRIVVSQKILGMIITVLLHVALIVSVYGIRQQFIGVEQLATWNDPNSPLAEDTRVYSYLGNPNLLAAYLFSAIALSLAAVFVWPSLVAKALALLMFITNLTCLYFTDSRGGWIGAVALMTGFILMLYIWYYPRLPQWGKRWLLPVVTLIMLGIILVALVTVEPLRLRVMSIFAGREDSSNNFRINVWYAVLDMIKARPWLGIGPGNEAFNQVYPLYMRPNYTALSAYSVFLEIAVETGLIGLVCFLGIIFTTFKQGIQQINCLKQFKSNRGFWVIGAMAAMVGLLAHGVVDTVWYRPQISTLWWLLVAIIAGWDGRSRQG